MMVDTPIIGLEKYFFQFPRFDQNQISVRFLWPARFARKKSLKNCSSMGIIMTISYHHMNYYHIAGYFKPLKAKPSHNF